MAAPGEAAGKPILNGYIPALDGLRAFAVLLVVAFHARVLPGGFVGVDVFFVLSAFLITRVLKQELDATGGIRLLRFSGRRLARLGPALVLMLATYLAVAPLLWPRQPHVGDALLAAFYVSDYSFAAFGRPLYLQHSWSLAVEEQFYLAWPLMLPLLLRSRRPLHVLAVAYVALIWWRAGFGDDWRTYYYRADTRCTGLVIGAGLALAIDRLDFSRAHALTGALLVMLAAVLGRFGPDAALVFPVAEVGAALLVGAAAQGQLGALQPALCASSALLIGKLSYGIYLWHYPITIALRPWFDGAALFVLVLVPSVGLAWLSWVTVEQWPRRLRRPDPAPALQGSR
ncbi:acyltransferase [Sphingomonas sabuli]|uniref:Acyltransferase n=1 Tax=Sphingomonas sabuli TaxID=2764186 RepID=A0A7G9KZX5_9SPHN|nr:acyltransferase [Sphingomonas sabuli]QNM81924.1 acyltransferase [Sphingomonas sabuli]